MADYIICTDTGSDLTGELYAKYDIVPLVMEYELDGQMNEGFYADDKLKKFYDGMRGGDAPKTTQVNTATYVEFFEEQLKKSDTVIYIALSSGISGSCNNACNAAKEVMEKHVGSSVYVVDSLGACLMEGMLAISASKNRAAGMSAEDNVKFLNENCLNVNVYFTTPDLTYLQRGGRVSKTSAVVAHMLGINPILTVTPDGKLVSCDKVRGEKQTINKIQKNIAGSVVDPENSTIYIAHSDCFDRAVGVAAKYTVELGFKDSVITTIGTTIGSHTGPGLIAIFYYGEKRK